MSKDDDNDDNDGNKKDYEVGYKKPPKNRQFGAKDSNPQNKQGRPPGRNVLEFDRLSEEALWDSFIQAANTPVTIKEDGREMLVPYIMAQDAIKGDRHARKELLRMIEKATKGADKLRLDMHSTLANHTERKLKASSKPGSLEHFDMMYADYMTRKHLRPILGGDEFLYRRGEPITDEDWQEFIRQHEHLKANPSDIVQWPPKYPSDDPEE